MKIVDRTALRVALILFLILGIFSIYVYYFYADFREKIFYDQLKANAISQMHFIHEIKNLKPETLQKMDSMRINKLKGEEISIFDANGKLIYHSLPFYKQLDSNTLHILKNKQEIRLEKDDFERVIFVVFDSHVNKTAILESAGYDNIGFSKQENLKRILIIGLLVSVFIIAIVTHYFISLDLQPIQQIVGKMEQISAKNLYERLSESALNDELGQMALTFNNLLDRLEAAYSQQHNFVSYVTHELRTPLTVMQGQVEVGLMKERQSSEYKSVLESVAEEVRGMTKLVNDLLELARANADSQSIDFHQVRVDELLWQVRTQLLQKHPAYNIAINFENFPENEDQMTIQGNPHLLRMAFINVMENACKYAHGSVNIIINAAQDFMEIRTEDNGEGILPKDLEHIFEPFYRAKSATISEISGHGIGLPLTKRIVEIHRGKCTIESVLHVGTKLIFRLPYH